VISFLRLGEMELDWKCFPWSRWKNICGARN